MLDYWQGFPECLFCTPFLMDILNMCYMYFGDLMDQVFFCLSYITLSKMWHMLQKHQEWRLFCLENVAYTAQGLKTSSKPTSEPDTKYTVPDEHCLAVFAKDHIHSAIRSNQASYP